MLIRKLASAILLALALIAAPAAAKDRVFSVTVEGQGPDVILIPGLMSGRHVWDGAVASLGGKYRIHRLQLAGFAGEPPAAGQTVLDPVVEALHAYIAEQGLERPAVIGHSMGGLTGLLLAARHPGDVGRLMVVDALPFYPLLFSPHATVDAVRPQASQLAAAVAAMGDDAFRAQQEGTLASLVRTAEARPRLLADSMASDRAFAARAIAEVMTTDARASLGAIEAPLTVLHATNSYAPAERMGPLYRAAYSGAPKARLIEVPESYHFIMFDQPAVFEGHLKAFLAAE
jgi:pimeloyl-[acyl-carrier protein] methyl ester esterase